MSNFFTANSPFAKKSDTNQTDTGKSGAVTSLPTSQAGGPSSPFTPPPTTQTLGQPAVERKPLFPPRDPSTSREAASPLFPTREVNPKPDYKPLFPPKDVTHQLGGTAATTAPDQAKPERPSLFQRNADGTLHFNRDNAGSSSAVVSERTASAPLFSNLAARTGVEPAKSLFEGKVEAPTTPKPAFMSKPASAPITTASAAKPLFDMGSDASRTMRQGTDTRISDDEFAQLRDFLYQQSGIFIAENRKYLVENRLSSRLRDLGLRNFGEYHNYLRLDNNRAKELNKLFELMTTNETSFFRNGPQLDIFRDKVLVPLIDDLRTKGQKKLRIWSAGCSSGEEPYTLAIILSEVLKQEITSWDIKITANDLSLAVLSLARTGLYSDYALRTTPPEIIAKYFKLENKMYRIEPKLANLISFGQINLNDKGQLQKVERSQIIFCRNVIIYFDDPMKKHVIGAFYDNLLPGGNLLIGHSESLHNISRTFKPIHYSGTIVYSKQS